MKKGEAKISRSLQARHMRTGVGGGEGGYGGMELVERNRDTRMYIVR
jgi:hypothetical protein